LVLEDFLNADIESRAYTAWTTPRKMAAPSRVLLLCACLILDDEARTAIRFIRETPGLDFVNGSASSDQAELLSEGEE
jgi:hypothetical protein